MSIVIRYSYLGGAGMGPWSSAIIAVTALVAIVLAVLAFRGLMEAVDVADNRCDECGRAALLPLPVRRHTCHSCRHVRRA